MDLRIRYFDDCPNWRAADDVVHEALATLGLSETLVRHEQVTTMEAAERLGFTGSPTILVDGVDPFASLDDQPGLACRVYSTPDGLRGAPSLAQVVAALQSRERR
ncbi:MAG: thioredoxin family protein [Actinomycetes bacterium]